MMAIMKFGFPLPHMMELKALTQPWELDVTGADQARIARRAEALGMSIPGSASPPAKPESVDGPVV